MGRLGSLAVRTGRSARRDRIGGVAAELASFLLLSIPPAILIVAGLAGYAGDLFGSDFADTLRRQIVKALGTFLQPDTMRDFVRPAVDDLFARGRADILSVGALLAVWSSSRAANVFMHAMNIAYHVDRPRIGWSKRLAAVVLTLAGLLALAVILPFILAGPGLGEVIADHTVAPDWFGALWRVSYWPVAVLAGVALLASIYEFASRARAKWRSHLAGALVAAATWLVAAIGLRAYANVSLGKGSAFGPLAAPIILLLWLYISAIAVLVGAELNAELIRGELPTAMYSEPPTGE
jgi:membrane protein